jgi:hypothetical protein
MTEAAAKGLGVEVCSVKSQLYKLLVYGPGGHFKPHRDTEKEAGMFGTLVGGSLQRHLGTVLAALLPAC